MPSLRGYDDDPLIFDDGEFLGGYGDPDDAYNVNGYSWDVSADKWWVPYHGQGMCKGADDAFPICSLKRKVPMDVLATVPGPVESGQALRELDEFANFTRWFIDDTKGGPRAVRATLTIMSQSFDPIWVLFHSFIQLQQFLWTDCHEYDQIAPDDLDEYPHAYSAFCDPENFGFGCGGQKLDDAFEYPLGSLYDAEWSFIHSQPLTVRKSYHAPRWNIKYDLGDGSGFWENGGVDEWCADNLNAEWFTLSRDDNEEKALSRSVLLGTFSQMKWLDPSYVFVFVTVGVLLMALAFVQARKRSDQKT